MPGGIKQSDSIQVLEVGQVKVYNLDGKVMPSLSKLVSGKSAPEPVVVLKPGEYSLTGFGSGIPKGDLPKRCLSCHRSIGRGQRWVSTFNGQYTVIRHSDCCRKRKLVL